MKTKKLSDDAKTIKVLRETDEKLNKISQEEKMLKYAMIEKIIDFYIKNK